MIECGKCGAKIPADRVRAYRTPSGVYWKQVAWCEGCDHLLMMRRAPNGVTWRMSLITDKSAVRRFVESLPLKPEIQRNRREAS